MMKNKFLMLVVAMAMLIAMTGVVMATSPVTDTKITEVYGNLVPPSITITPPGTVSWDLSKANLNNNEKNIGSVTVSTTGAYSWDLKVSDSKVGVEHVGYMLSTPFSESSIPLANPIWVSTTTIGGFSTLVSGEITLATGNADTGVPVYLRQVMDSGDNAEQYSIVLTFTGSAL